MSASQSTHKFVSNGSRPSYGVLNRAVPLPRQWQLPGLQMLVPCSMKGIHHFYPGPSDAGNWLEEAPQRWMKSTILFDLGLLAVLTTIADCRCYTRAH